LANTEVAVPSIRAEKNPAAADVINNFVEIGGGAAAPVTSRALKILHPEFDILEL